MLVFPPTIRTENTLSKQQPQIILTAQGSGGFQFIGSLNEGYGYVVSGYSSTTISMDVGQLVIQVVIMSLIAAALWFAFRPQKDKVNVC